MLTLLFTILMCSLLAAYGALISYYRRAWLAIPEFDATGRSASTRISVIVPARNEAMNISACLESLNAQTYPKELYEVIVIDDQSTDGTREVVQGLRFPGLALVSAPVADTHSGRPGHSGRPAHKKRAIETGVGMASGDLIVTTDADCVARAGWLQTLAVFYEEKGAKFIAAPVRMGDPRSGRPAEDNPGRSALDTFQVLDFITLQGITGASVAARFHSMCNGANLAYEKSAFDAVGGFRQIDDIPSGDDMLLMHKIYTRYPQAVHFLRSDAAIVSTKPETTWSDFVHQRVRWASKADRYDDKRIFWVLLLVYILNVAILALAVTACFHPRLLWLLAGCLVVKTAVEYPFVSQVAGFFGQRSLMKWFPLLQPFHIVYTVVIGWMGKFAGYRWKDRLIQR